MVLEPIPADMEDQQEIIQVQELDHDHVTGNSFLETQLAYPLNKPSHFARCASVTWL